MGLSGRRRVFANEQEEEVRNDNEVPHHAHPLRRGSAEMICDPSHSRAWKSLLWLRGGVLILPDPRVVLECLV